jgi:hypothetical protein
MMSRRTKQDEKKWRRRGAATGRSADNSRSFVKGKWATHGPDSNDHVEHAEQEQFEGAEFGKSIWTI